MRSLTYRPRAEGRYISNTPLATYTSGLEGMGFTPAARNAASAQEVEDARALVLEEVADFLGLRRAAQVAPTVVALRSMASEVVASELRRLDARLPHLDDHERDQIQRSMRRIVDKLLHAPTVRVQELSAEPDAMDYAAALRELFGRSLPRPSWRLFL